MKKVKELKVGDNLENYLLYLVGGDTSVPVKVTKITSTRIYTSSNGESSQAYIKKSSWPLRSGRGAMITVVDEIAPKEYWDKLKSDRAKRKKLLDQYNSYSTELSTDQLEKVVDFMESNFGEPLDEQE